MRVLLTHHPAAGHFLPLVPLADALCRAGHQVAFACGRRFCPTVENAGFRCFAAGLDDFTFGRARAGPMLADLLGICSAWRPDVLVRDSLEFGGCIAAESLGVPHASVQVGAHCPPEPPWELIGGELATLRGRVGLSTRGPFDMLYRYLHLAFAPPSYQGLGAFIPATNRTLGTVDDERARQVANPPERLAGLPDRPTIYLTLGTISASHDRRTLTVLKTVTEGLRQEDVNLIVTVGDDLHPAALGAQPPNVQVARYIPQSKLLPRCQLVVTHGGYGTVLGALAEGLPLVVIPLFADQAENARRCLTLGVGQAIAPEILTSDLVRAVALEVSRNPTFRDNARRIQQEMRSLPGPAHAVALLERLAADAGDFRYEKCIR